MQLNLSELRRIVIAFHGRYHTVSRSDILRLLDIVEAAKRLFNQMDLHDSIIELSEREASSIKIQSLITECSELSKDVEIDE